MLQVNLNKLQDFTNHSVILANLIIQAVGHRLKLWLVPTSNQQWFMKMSCASCVWLDTFTLYLLLTFEIINFNIHDS